MSYRDDLDAARARRDALARELTDLRERLGDRAALEARERELAAAVVDANRRVDHARGQVKLPLLQEIRVASPCNERWDAMTGDDRMRFCGSCKQHVFDLSAMTTAEAEGFLRERTGALCVRFYRRADGTVLTADCPEGVRRRRRRRFAVAGAAVAVLASLAGGVARALTGRPTPKPPEHVMGAITPARPPAADDTAPLATDAPPPR